MSKLILIDRDDETQSAIKALGEALEIEVAEAYSLNNAVRHYATGYAPLILIDVSMGTLDVRHLMEEVANQNRIHSWPAPKFYYLYSDFSILQRSEAYTYDHSGTLKKPLDVVELYTLLQQLGMTKLRRGQVAHTKDRITKYKNFLSQADAWMDALKAKLMPGS